MTAKTATLVAVLCTLTVAPVAHSAPGTGVLFGSDANPGNLITIDPVTGAGTIVGFMAINSAPALAVDPTTGKMYAGSGTGTATVYTIDPTTGASTLVGPTGLERAAVGGMDFSANGTLFATVNIVGLGGTGSDHLATIDKATGRATVIGPFGTCGQLSCSIEGMEGIAFDQSDTLFGSSGGNRAIADGTAGLYTINPATGAATFKRPILDPTGTPPSGGVVSLQLACDGTLYGGTSRPREPRPDGGRLITIDPASGRFNFVGSQSTTTGSSLGALAFQRPCLPDSKDECKNGGWQTFGFKNQGDCVSSVATGARNQPAG